MLCQFKFENFKSYRDETILDLQATPAKEHIARLLTYGDDKKRFLPISVIYGPNAGGKTGIVEALSTLVSVVMKPIDYMSKDPQQLFSTRHYDCTPFAFDKKSQELPTVFTVYFRHDNLEFRYIIKLCDGNVLYESLHKKTIAGKIPAKIFERNAVDVEFGAALSKRCNKIDVNPQMPYISYLAINYNIDIINSAIDWFSKCLFMNYSGSLEYNNTFSLISELKTQLIQKFNEVDIPISNFDIKYVKDERSGKEIADTILLSRVIAGNEYKLDISEESSGTVKLLSVLPFALTALSEGSLLVVDELDASLHTKLLRYIIKLFANKDINKKGAQLIFTSHDVNTMKSELFRRDEIWFAAKDDEGVSDIYSLYEIRNEDGSHIKSTSSFDKQYIEGRYGADPYLSEMLGIEWD